jgi:hypothetical protein
LYGNGGCLNAVAFTPKNLTSVAETGLLGQGVAWLLLNARLIEKPLSRGIDNVSKSRVANVISSTVDVLFRVRSSRR